jgi:hypothetical protein
MKLVIDANVVKAYFMESVLEIDGELTCSTLHLFERLNVKDQVFLDENGQIKHEWREPVGKEWFDAWYPGLLLEGAAFEIPVKTEHQLRNRLESGCGFQKGNKDFWYIKTAKAVVEIHSEVFLISEDMDLHEPSKKNARGENRINILLSGNGRVIKLLRKENIFTLCVSRYLDFVQ